MKKIYLYILVFVSYGIFSSCGNKYNITLIKILNNTTEKDLYYEINTYMLGSKTMYVEAFNTDSIVLYQEGNAGFGMDPAKPKISVSKEVVYNLTDTTMFEIENYELYQYDISNLSEAKQQYINNFTHSRDGMYKGNIKCWEKVDITDAFLHLLPKDYSMLDKFPEYYRK